MDCLMSDHEAAVREVARVYELIKNQQEPLETTMLAQSLLIEALRALNIALSVVKQQQPDSSSTNALPQQIVEAQLQLSPCSPASAAADSTGATCILPKNRKRRRSSGTNTSWAAMTKIPYEDGFEWRKYGEKKINGTHFTRSYFRCAYKDDKGCLATKYVQQKDDNSDPPIFEVTYNNNHTCYCTTTSPAKKNYCDNLLITGAISHPIFHSDTMPIQQEATVVLPPPLEFSAVPLDQYQVPHIQEPIPTGDHYITEGDAPPYNVIPTATWPISAGDSFCDNLDLEWIMELLMQDDH